MSTADEDATAVMEAIPAEAAPPAEVQPEPAPAVEVPATDGTEELDEPALDAVADFSDAGWLLEPDEDVAAAPAEVPAPVFKGPLTIDKAILNDVAEWRYLAIPSLPPRPPTPGELAAYAARLDAPEWAHIYNATPPVLARTP